MIAHTSLAVSDYAVSKTFYKKALAPLGYPVQVVHGREDPIPLASSEALARALGAELVVLAECGHVPYVEQPQALSDAIHRFLRDTVWVAVRWYRPDDENDHAAIADQYLNIVLDGLAVG